MLWQLPVGVLVVEMIGVALMLASDALGRRRRRMRGIPSRSRVDDPTGIPLGLVALTALVPLPVWFVADLLRGRTPIEAVLAGVSFVLLVLGSCGVAGTAVLLEAAPRRLRERRIIGDRLLRRTDFDRTPQIPEYVPPPPLPPAVFLVVGLLAGLVALLPWLAHGATVPLQDLRGAGPIRRPITLLPFSQYWAGTLVSFLAVGGALGGVALRALPGGHLRGRRALMLLGVLVAQAAEVAQAAAATAGVLRPGTAATAYIGAFVGVSIAAALIGAVVLLLLTAPARAAVVVGAAVTAPLVAGWASPFFAPPGGVLYTGPSWPISAVPWVGPLVVGAVVGWSGLRTAGRIAAAAFAAFVLWVGPPVVQATADALSTPLGPRFPELLGFIPIEVRHDLAVVALPLPVVAAAAVAVAVLVAGASRRPPLLPSR